MLRVLHIADEGKSETFCREFATCEIPGRNKGREKKSLQGWSDTEIGVRDGVKPLPGVVPKAQRDNGVCVGPGWCGWLYRRPPGVRAVAGGPAQPLLGRSALTATQLIREERERKQPGRTFVPG